MDEAYTRFDIGHSFGFRSLLMGLLQVHVLSLEVGQDVVLEGQLDCDAALEVFATGTFHVDEADEPQGWDAEVPIDITLRLRGPIASRYPDAETLLKELLKDEYSPLRHTEAWLLLEAMQKTEVPGEPGAYASFGVRTDWAGPIL